MTAQYDVANDAPDVSLRSPLYEVGMLADENGRLWNTRYGKDAWGRHKSVIDKSIFSATFTHSVPARTWEESLYTPDTLGQEIPKPSLQNSRSIGGLLSVKSGTTFLEGTVLRSKIFPRYRPNRGHLYSTAVICPNTGGVGYASWGLGSAQNGVNFVYGRSGSAWELGVSRWKNGVYEQTISLKPYLPADFDPTKGHVYDIQFQWRGVGNYYFFVDTKLVYTLELLGTLDSLSIQDPAMPASFRVVNQDPSGTLPEMEILVGCVDITSEGGEDDSTVFGSVNTGDSLVTLSTSETAILAVYVPKTIIYNGQEVLYSRSAIPDKLVTWTRDESLTKVWIFRNTAAVNLESIPHNNSTNPLLEWSSVPDSYFKYMVGGLGSVLDTAFLADKAAGAGVSVLQQWADIDAQNVIVNPSKNSPFYVTPGDMLVVTVTSTGAANVKSSASLLYSEQI